MNKFSDKLICLVDDEQVFHWIAEHLIKRVSNGLKTISLFNGNEALEYLGDPTNQLPDVVFLDLNMPIANGWKFLDEFESVKDKLDKQIAIYIVSSSVDPEDHKKAKKYSYVNGFISKPLTQETIERVIKPN